MINSLLVSNVQSHELAELTFSPGVNSIIGSSDSGKTALLRAILWTATNRPSGNVLISHWSFNEKGKQEERSQVTIQIDDKEITRTRTATKNGYSINGKDFDVVGRDVPEEIAQALNFSDVNLQRQMDASFLLSESDAEVARYFNQIIRLDIIDKILQKAESNRIILNRDKVQTENEIKTTKEKLDSLDWTDDAESLLIKSKNVENRITDKKIDISRIEADLDHRKSAQGIVSNIESFLEESARLVNSIEKLRIVIELSANQERILSKSIRDHSDSCNKIDTLSFFEPAYLLVEKIEKATADSAVKKNEKRKLEETLTEFNSNMKEKIKAKNEIEVLTNSLPENCPLCGKPLGGVV